MPTLTWMQGTGNRFALIDQADLAGSDPAALALQLAGGPGGIDGLLVLEMADHGADLAMRVINADGSPADMCGNGLRCVAYDAARRGQVRGRTIRIRVGDHVLGARVIPTRTGEAMVCARMPVPRVELGSELMRVHLGNVHGVLLHDSLPGELNWAEQVRLLHEQGLRDLNLHAVSIVDDSTIELRSWERGVGPTLACASGATAAVAALASRGLIGSVIRVNQPGGPLRVRWRGHNRQPTNIGAVGDVSGLSTASDPEAAHKVEWT